MQLEDSVLVLTMKIIFNFFLIVPKIWLIILLVYNILKWKKVKKKWFSVG
jgi:hypothetical protein